MTSFLLKFLVYCKLPKYRLQNNKLDFGTKSLELGGFFMSHLWREGCFLVVSGSYRA